MLLVTPRRDLNDPVINEKLSQLAEKRTHGPSGLTRSKKQKCFGNLWLAETWNTAWHSNTRLFSLFTSDGRVWALDSSRDLHKVRMELDLAPVGDDAVSWLRVFNFITRGDGGPFMLLDNPARVTKLCDLRRATTSEYKLAKMCRKPVVVDVEGEKTQVGARVLYGGGIFDALFSVGRSGVTEDQPRDDWPGAFVEMVDDHPVATTDLACSVDLAAPLRFGI